MNRVKRFIPYIGLILWDMTSSIAALYLAALLRFPYTKLDAPVYTNMPFFCLFGFAIFVICGCIFGCYSSVLRHIGLSDAIRQFFCVCLSSCALFFTDTFGLVNFVFPQMKGYHNDTSIYILSAALLYMLSIFGRFFIRMLLSAYSKIQGMSAHDVERILIFGAGEAGVFLRAKMENHPQDKLKPVVFIDDDDSVTHRRISGLRVYGTREDLGEAIEKYNIDKVIVAIPTATRELLQYVLDVCREHKCKIQRFGTIDNVDLNKVTLTNINYEDLLRRDQIDLNMDAVYSFVKDKVILVTGGAGSIGSEICRQVLKFQCRKLIVFDFNENGLFYINNELSEKYDKDRFVMRLGSIRDVERLNEVFDEFSPQVVFHAAAHKHVPMSEINPREVIKNNVFGTLKTAKVAGEHKAEKFILISTDKAVNPTNIMGASKRVAEFVIRTANSFYPTEYAAVRFGNVLGSNGSVVPFFQNQINNGGPVTVTHPDMRRYFMTIPEAVQLVLESGAMANGSEVFVLDMGKPVRIYDLACDLIRLSGFEPGVDIKIEFTGLRPGEKMFEEISVKGESFLPTPNEKIVILKPDEHDLDGFSSKLETLSAASDSQSFADIYRLVKDIVPTFNYKKSEENLA